MHPSREAPGGADTLIQSPHDTKHAARIDGVTSANRRMRECNRVRDGNERR